MGRMIQRVSTSAVACCLWFVFPCSTAFGININAQSVKALARAYGFVAAQRFTLDRIASEIPELEFNVARSRADFDARFPGIEGRLKAVLSDLSNGQGLGEVETALDRTKEMLGRQQLSREAAMTFLKEVQSRARGEIESPVLEYLLAVQYEGRPVAEFLAGFRNRYRTDGGGKSLGIVLSLQTPRSWAASEGERPHIVQKWTSEGGTGLDTIMLDIRRLEGPAIAKKQIDDLLQSGEIRSLLPGTATYVSSGSFTVEGLDGYWVQMTASTERAGVAVFVQSILHQLPLDGRIVGLTCASGALPDDPDEARQSFEQLRPLCQQVLNSLVLPQRY